MQQLAIKSIEFVDSEEDVYDIMVDDNHNFFTNGGILSSNCFVILDEAQNSTPKQMKMFLTRIGYESFYCVDGDVTQSDLVPPRGVSYADFENGLQYAIRKLVGKSRFVNLIQFTAKDIVRSDQAREIVALLDSPDERREAIDTKSKLNENSKASATLFTSPQRAATEAN